MRVCECCKIEKADTDFYGTRKICKRCGHKRIVDYRRKGAPGFAKAKAYHRQYRSASEHRAYVDAAKDVPCKDCNTRFPPYVMDFDHVTGEKLGDIATMASQLMSLDLIKAEIEKCEVVCSNCHRIRTYKRRLECANG